MLFSQLICAFAPAAIAIAIAAVVSPSIGKLLLKSLQFDLATIMLITAAFAVLFALNRGMSEIQMQSWRKYQRERQEQLESGWSVESLPSYSSYETDYQLAALHFLSVLTVPSLIIVRLLMEAYRDERRTRLERREKQTFTAKDLELPPITSDDQQDHSQAGGSAG
jgi:energy-converting hydrogenase Eha subunit E